MQDDCGAKSAVCAAETAAGGRWIWMVTGIIIHRFEC
jgi:hypothetical protein